MSSEVWQGMSTGRRRRKVYFETEQPPENKEVSPEG